MDERSVGYWNYFAEEARLAGAPLYARLAEGVAGDDSLQALANNARQGQPPANLLFAAVHFLLLRGAAHPLRRHYANLAAGAPPPDEDPFPLFADFCARHEESLCALIRARVTNTNEVGRSATLAAGFRALGAEAGEPLHLIEIGPSAGLNLIWDRYLIRYRRGPEERLAGPADSGLTLESEVRGNGFPPTGRTPRIASRLGLERHPVDLSDAGDRDWLRALVWPDRVERFRRLEAAMAMFVAAPPAIRAGDALSLLPEALAEAPQSEPVCVYHSFVTYQFSGEARAALGDLLTAAGLRRTVWRMSFEGSAHNQNTLTLRRYRDGLVEKRILARSHPHGAWIEWLA
ncbi:MAG TPA: DUF2332 domain-containing protein [Rhizomicrobium sp.]|nr:DUF2332 domain-containing protein [Rhizomicrobium sp.]